MIHQKNVYGIVTIQTKSKGERKQKSKTIDKTAFAKALAMEDEACFTNKSVYLMTFDTFGITYALELDPLFPDAVKAHFEQIYEVISA